MKELVERIVKVLVDSPEQVLTGGYEENGTVFMELRVAEDDLGKIIGKGGNTINAIRMVASAAGGRHKGRVELNLVN